MLFYFSFTPVIEKSSEELRAEALKKHQEKITNKQLFDLLSLRDKKIYIIAKHIAENDSIGEMYSYWSGLYSVLNFKEKDCEYKKVAIDIYNELKKLT